VCARARADSGQIRKTVLVASAGGHRSSRVSEPASEQEEARGGELRASYYSERTQVSESGHGTELELLVILTARGGFRGRDIIANDERSEE
jgi:hypothetical protein